MKLLWAVIISKNSSFGGFSKLLMPFVVLYMKKYPCCIGFLILVIMDTSRCWFYWLNHSYNLLQVSSFSCPGFDIFDIYLIHIPDCDIKIRSY